MPPLEPPLPVRKLKIEADGDFSKGLIKPKIRLTGRWLERAGFRPGNLVLVTCYALGVIELRSPGAGLIMNDAPQVSSEPPEPGSPTAGPSGLSPEEPF